MSIIKKLREKSGFTQVVLAEKAGLSLRTIQRLETGNKAPKGHTLGALSKVFNIDSSVLQEGVILKNQIKEDDKTSIRLINLSVFAFMVIPFGNLILPYLVWKRRRTSQIVDETGKKIINFQIIWSIVLAFMLCVSPFINIGLTFSMPLILIVLFLAIAINIIVICLTAFMLSRDKVDFLNLPIRLI